MSKDVSTDNMKIGRPVVMQCDVKFLFSLHYVVGVLKIYLWICKPISLHLQLFYISVVIFISNFPSFPCAISNKRGSVVIKLR